MLSVRLQHFADWEIVVSDNSDSRIAAQNELFVRSFCDPRVRYIRPTEVLSMVDHWEWAFEQTEGKYVGVVTDRMVLRLFALFRIDTVIRAQQRPVAVSYRSLNASEMPGYRGLRFSKPSGRATTISTDAKLRDFASGKLSKDTPRVLNSFIRRDVLDQLKRKYGRLFDGLSPDYFLTFRVMDEVEQFVSLEDALLVTQGEHLSNGRAHASGDSNAASHDFWKTVSAERKKFLSLGPIPHDIHVMPNVILREYEAVAAANPTTRLLPIDLRGFYLNACRYATGLAASGELGEASREALDDFANTHSLPMIDLPQNRHRHFRNRSKSIWHAASSAIVVRILFERLLWRLGLSDRLSASNIIEVLKADARASLETP